MSNATRQPRGPTLDPLLLQAYFDGELDAEETAHVEQLLADSSEDQLRLEALGEMHELVRFDLEQQVEDVELGGLWSRIDRELDAQQVLERNEKEAPTLAPAAPSTSTESQSWWAAFKAFFAGHKAVLVPTLVAATVIMLVVVPLMLNQAPPERVVERERTIVVIDEPLRFEGNSTGTVSYTPGTNTPVIWYLGEPETHGGASPPGDTSTADPALLRRDITLPIPVDKLLERLERLERLVVPNSNTTPTPPPVDDRTGRTPQDGPI